MSYRSSILVPSCDENQAYYSCKPCPQSCRDEPVACFKMCLQGCSCKPGYVLEFPKSTKCIAREMCTLCGQNEIFDADKECTEPNRVFSPCHGHCPKTCEKNKICTAVCTAGCVCKDGMVLHNGKCIMESKCPITKCTEPNQVFSLCDGHCPKTCDKHQGCPEICSPGCVCKDGMVLHNGKCMLESKCPITEDNNCLKNQVWDSCGTACPINCENVHNPQDFCTMQCVPECFCVKPYIFLSGKSGPCVLPKDCPTYKYENCLKNQVWNSCGTACPRNCENFRNAPDLCKMQCVPDCFCVKPYIFQSGKSGPCVLPIICPPNKLQNCAREMFLNTYWGVVWQ
ncbi:von Willebrand factor-like [Pelodytes ibericus]